MQSANLIALSKALLLERLSPQRRKSPLGSRAQVWLLASAKGHPARRVCNLFSVDRSRLSLTESLHQIKHRCLAVST